MRFSLVYVDFATRKRIVKNSSLWYTRLIHSNILDTEVQCEN